MVDKNYHLDCVKLANVLKSHNVVHVATWVLNGVLHCVLLY